MRMPILVLFGSLAVAAGTASGAAIGYFQQNLTSDIPGLAQNTDPLLKNPWGMSFSATSPFWISDQATDVSTLYNGTGVPQALVVSTPPTPGPGPTGQVFAGGAGFTGSIGGTIGPATFIFSTLAGTIDAWNATAGTTASIQVPAAGAVYTGLALLGSRLYAADTKNGKIDVYDNTFHQTTVTGTFTDPNVTAGFTPYNIQTVGSNLYVEYALRNQPGGFVAVFDANGNLLQHISDSHLNAPWGVTLAPAGFGQFANDLLVGNFGNGMINAFNPTSGAFIGTLSDSNGNPIVNSGLWALDFRNGTGFDPNTLFFTAGINNEADGLFGAIQTVPEPATLGSAGTAIAIWALAGLARRRKRQNDAPR